MKSISDLEWILKSILRLLITVRTKMQIRIDVKHQYECTGGVLILHSSDNYNNKLYVKTIDKFYVIIHVRII